MRYSLAQAAAFLCLFQTTTAASCTGDNATPIEQYLGSDGTGGGGAGGVKPGFYTEVYKVLSYAVKRSETPDARLANVAYILQRGTSVQCTITEMCLSIQKVPFCLDITTGGFHDGDGTTGNALTGDYTLADGRKGNMYNGPHPLPSGSSTEAAATTAAAGAGATNTPGAGAAAGTSPTGTGNPAVATNGASGSDKIGTFAVGGALALAGIML
ncbi:hypothetical protein OQA88_701 [Cercophora sp. LCS_1]